MKILIACEESQAVCKAFRERGHEAYSCDILETSGGHPEWHIKDDVLKHLNENWDMVIAFPPCTYLSNAAACRLYPKKGQLNQERYLKGLDAKEFFMLFYNYNCPRIAIENPISSIIFDMPKYTQEIQPYQFGHPFSKKTRLWLKGLPKLIPTNIVECKGSYLPAGTSRKDKSKYGLVKRSGGDALNRSKTFEGIAEAIATQFTAFVNSGMSVKEWENKLKELNIHETNAIMARYV